MVSETGTALAGYVYDTNAVTVTFVVGYTGSVIVGSGATAPTDGVLAFNEQGKATINLKYGQSITISGLLSLCQYTMEETLAVNYTPSPANANSLDMTQSATTAFVNIYNITTSAEILLEVWPYLLIALGGCITFIAVRKKHR